MKLLDEKGIGTVWSICKEKFALVGHTHNYAGSGSPGGSANSAIGVVDYNQTGKTIQIGYSGTGITGDQIKYIAGYTDGSGNVNAKIKDVSKDALKSWLGLDLFVRNVDAVTGVTFSTNVNTNDIQLDVEKADGTVVNAVVPEATEFNNGIISKEDKVKLNGIAAGANNYTLPTASDTTLGGVKASGYKVGDLWPITVNNNGVAYTSIAGLGRNSIDGTIRDISTKNNQYSTKYGPAMIQKKDTNQNKSFSLNLPSKSGTLALTDDIPDVSNLCKLNFVDSISDCVDGRINFLFKNSNDYVDLSFLRNLEEGTISLIYSPFVEFQITDKGSVWYYNGRSVASEDTAYISKAKLVLAFFKDIYVYVCTFS